MTNIGTYVSDIEAIAKLVSNSKYTIAFTGAGISVESGIPPFRGEGGLWNKYDPQVLDLEFFYNKPTKSWEVISEVFYDFFSKCEPNTAHKVLSKWEQKGLIKAIITQNIDDLHQQAGSKVIYEFHGNASRLVCTICETTYTASALLINNLPPLCEKCSGLLKPDFVFFGEGIPEKAYLNSFEAAQSCDLCIIIGTSGEVSPANQIPVLAKKSGAVIVEINKDKSLYTSGISDYFLQGSAVEILSQIDLYIEKTN